MSRIQVNTFGIGALALLFGTTSPQDSAPAHPQLERQKPGPSLDFEISGLSRRHVIDTSYRRHVMDTKFGMEWLSRSREQ